MERLLPPAPRDHAPPPSPTAQDLLGLLAAGARSDDGRALLPPPPPLAAAWDAHRRRICRPPTAAGPPPPGPPRPGAETAAQPLPGPVAAHTLAPLLAAVPALPPCGDLKEAERRAPYDHALGISSLFNAPVPGFPPPPPDQALDPWGPTPAPREHVGDDLGLTWLEPDATPDDCPVPSSPLPPPQVTWRSPRPKTLLAHRSHGPPARGPALAPRLAETSADSSTVRASDFHRPLPSPELST